MIKIVVDSGCDLTSEMRNNIGINVAVIPLTLQLGEVTYIDDIDLDIDEYLNAVDAYPESAKTAAPAPQNFFEAYKGEESIFVLTLSQKLSGSYNSAVVAKEMYIEEYGEKFIHIFDTNTLSNGLTLMALKINELSKQNVSNEEIAKIITEDIKTAQIYGLLEKYDTLVKAGRVSPYVAKVASLLSFKVIVFGDDGNIAYKDKGRGYKKASARLIDIISEQDIDFGKRTLAISHTRCLDRAIEFSEEISKNVKFKDIMILETSGLCATYANKDGFILSF